METIKNLNLGTEIEVEVPFSATGEKKKIVVDFTDRRFANKLLRLIQRYSNIGDELNEKFKGVDDIKDPIDKMLKCSDIEVEVLEEFKNSVDDVFGFKITDELFGKCLPSIERYFEFFECLTPYVIEANTREAERVKSIKSKYSLDRAGISNE